MARQFFDGDTEGSDAGPSFAVPHYLPPSEMARIKMNGRPEGQSLNEAWAREQEYQRAATENKAHAAWASEFGQGLQPSIPSSLMQHGIDARPDCEHQLKPDFANIKIMHRSSAAVVLHGIRRYVWQRNVNGHVQNGREFQHGDVPTSELRHN